MHEGSKPHGPLDANRVHLTLAIALAGAAIAAGIALGHHPAGAQTTAGAALEVGATPQRPADPARDLSVPLAADALRGAPPDAAEPTSTF